MNILLCLDKTLKNQLIGLIYNISKSQISLEKITIEILYSGLTNKDTVKITSYANSLGLKIVMHLVSQDLCRGFPTWGHGSLANYFRLFFTEIIDPTSSRTLYLDLDIVIFDDLTELWEIDLQNQTIGAHGDDDKSFNSGIMLIDNDKWLKNDIPTKTRAIINEGKIPLTWWDNDILNHIFFQGWLDFGKKWNLMPNRFKSSKTEPVIVHFAGSSKPWHGKYNLPYASSYKKNFGRARLRYIFQSMIRSL
jgi:lipopolysaccharide biosynthesis glycosyltransferase